MSLTSIINHAPLFRVTLKPNAGNGLLAESDIMVDKITALDKARLKTKIGAISREELDALDRVLAFVVGM